MPALSVKGLAKAYDHLDRDDDAIQLLRELIDVQPGAAEEQLVDLLDGRSQFSEKENLYLSIIEREKRLRAEGSERALNAMNGLAVLYSDQGMYDRAEHLLLELCEIQRRTPGSDPARGLIDLGNVYRQLALPLRRELLEYAVKSAEDGRRLDNDKAESATCGIFQRNSHLELTCPMPVKSLKWP